MLDSVIAQEWDNIELILVNDGSTDGTREIITEYEPKLKQRGFEVVIIDQKNAGVSAAAKAGFERITGDYMCSVDCDDELDPKYVSTLAGWLALHQEYDIAACEGINYTSVGKKKQFQGYNPIEILDGDPYNAERWIFCDFRAEPWRYMVKTAYIKKCRITETYYTQTKGSHEPAYVIPLLSFGGRIKYFSEPLYYWNVNDQSHSRHKNGWKIKDHWNEYARLCKIAIEALPDEAASVEKKQNLVKATDIGMAFRIYNQTRELVNSPSYTPSDSGILSPHAHNNTYRFSCEFLKCVNELFSISPPIKRERVNDSEWLLYIMSKNCIANPKNRIVGCGALGKYASRYLPMLKGTPLEPTNLWDENGDGVTVKKPDYDGLTSNDIAVVFPSSNGVVSKSIQEKLKCAGCAIILAGEINPLVDLYLTFPELVRIGRTNV